MATHKYRTEIPEEIAARVLFESDRTCCVCRTRGRPVQIHHIDDDPGNSEVNNLAVVCFDCHRETQLRGGFDRKLDVAQIQLYRRDWVRRVSERRDTDGELTVMDRATGARTRIVRYLQIEEKSDEHFYSFDAAYPQIDSGDQNADAKTNLCISAFIARILDRIRPEIIAGSAQKIEILTAMPNAPVWDEVSVSHSISLFTAKVLSIEFPISTYVSMAMHPTTHTRTLNFQLQPSTPLELVDLFKPSSNYLDLLSQHCVNELHREQPSRFADSKERAAYLATTQDPWILRGAGPQYANYEHFVLVKGGMRVFFDPYQVGSYAEGRYDVFVPTRVLFPALRDSVAALLH